MLSPRPILKRSATPNVSLNHPHHVVHFPPSPSLTTHTFSVYSASTYDRSPIVVSPNTCALPERGCPGRTYNLDDDCQTSSQKGQYGSGELHPRAFYNASRSTYGLPPPLIPDISSSESEESDEVTSPLPDSDLTISSHLYGLAIPRDKYSDSCGGTYPPSSPALSFLPHPPSPTSRSAYPYKLSANDTPDQRPRRHREKIHEGSYDLGRIPSSPADSQQGTMSKNNKSRVSKLRKSLSTYHTTSDFRVEDDGCLGGF